MRNPDFGFYNSPEQREPVYKPDWREQDCPFCDTRIDSEDNLRTISCMNSEGPVLSFFYYVHRSCHESASQERQIEVDGIYLDHVIQHGRWLEEVGKQ